MNTENQIMKCPSASVSLTVSGFEFYLGILKHQTNQQMLVIVGHTLSEGSSSPGTLRMALTAHRSCLRPKETQASYRSFIVLPRAQTQSRTLILPTLPSLPQ